ncbi:MAG: hypothetical protein DRJ52_08560 [Thermoprotei archaeon]|nr:MAG: hypothetical protein DRJ52_08560 [Thermoprotei archaeon]
MTLIKKTKVVAERYYEVYLYEKTQGIVDSFEINKISVGKYFLRTEVIHKGDVLAPSESEVLTALSLEDTHFSISRYVRLDPLLSALGVWVGYFGYVIEGASGVVVGEP